MNSSYDLNSFVEFEWVSYMLILFHFCRHKALKDRKDEIFTRHHNLRDLASGLVL